MLLGHQEASTKVRTGKDRLAASTGEQVTQQANSLDGFGVRSVQVMWFGDTKEDCTGSCNYKEMHKLFQQNTSENIGKCYHKWTGHIYAYLSACLHVCVSACLPACVPACLRACLRACVPACLPACVRACACVGGWVLCVSLFVSVCLSKCVNVSVSVKVCKCESV